METITIKIFQDDVYEEVAKATDYTGSKLIDGDDEARDRILASDEDLAGLGRFWDEAVCAANEGLKEMLVSGKTMQVSVLGDSEITPSLTEAEITEPSRVGGMIFQTRSKTAYVADISVSKSFDLSLSSSVESTLRSYFIASIIGQWFKFANKKEAGDYLVQSEEFMEATKRLLYSRKRPTRPTD